MVSNMFNGNVFAAIVSGAKLVGYSSGFLLHDVAYNVSNQSYELLKSGLNININTVNGLDQSVLSIKASADEPDLPLFSIQHNASLESYETLLGNNEEVILSGVHSFIDFTIAS